MALRLEAGLGHFSAGAVLMPNLGLNLPYAGIGLEHNLPLGGHRAAPVMPASNRPVPGLPKTSLWVLAAAGAKQADYSYDPLRFCGTLRVEAMRRFGLRSAVSVGVDGLYNGALREKRTSLGLAPGSVVRMGLTLGHEWLVRSFAITTQVGAYVLNPAPEIDLPVYQRYGVRFNMNKRWQPAVFLRAHLGSADAVEACISYRICGFGLKPTAPQP